MGRASASVFPAVLSDSVPFSGPVIIPDNSCSKHPRLACYGNLLFKYVITRILSSLKHGLRWEIEENPGIMELAQRLRDMGLQEMKASIASKISRAGFSASFFLVVMKAIGREQVNIGDL